MKYFKNHELVSTHNVSDKAVRNWIQAAKDNKNQLQLYETDGIAYIADTLQNYPIIEELVDKGRKYRNQRSHRDIEPSPLLQEVFNRNQIIEIINELETHHTLPGHYKYFSEGAYFWDTYLHKLYSASKNNVVTNSVEALHLNLSYMEALVAGYDNVNIINLCVGNSMILKETVEHFQKRGKLKRVALVDISPDMLEISSRNLKEWLNTSVSLDTYQRDLSHERFDDILTQTSFGADAHNTVNLIFFLAGPIANFKHPDQALYTIGDSMGKDDILISTLKRDTSDSRRFFDFSVGSESLLSRHDSYLLGLLNIEESFYEPEQFYDHDKRIRIMQIRLKVDLSLTFNIDDYTKTLSLRRGDAIRVWSARHHNDREIIDRFVRTGFEVMCMNRSTDQQLNLLMTRLSND
jgi:uncharacterized SAM-dependent methyltransferase